MSKRAQLTRTVCFLAGTALCFLPPATLQAQVTLESSAASDTTSGATRDIQTNTFAGGIGINHFSAFNLASGQVLNLIQPDAATSLVNIVTGTEATQIAGILNFVGESGQATNAFLADPNGINVVTGGVITGDRLTLTTAGSELTALSIEEVAARIAGNEAALSEGAINIETGARIEATSVSIWTAGNLALYGLVSARAADPDNTPVGGAVNTSHVQSATHASVEDGVIRFGAGTATIGNGAQLTASRNDDPSDPSSDRQGGQIRAEVEDQLLLDAGATLSVEGIGYDAGVIALNSFTDGDVWIADGATLNASSDTGAAGLIYIGANTVNIGGSFDLGGTAGQAGDLVVVAQSVAIGTNAQPITDPIRPPQVYAGQLATQGGNLTIAAASIDLGAGALIDVTGVSDAGDVSLLGQTITASDVEINADAAGIADDGHVLLVADAEVNGRGLFLAPTPPADAVIALDRVTINAGAVAITATAIATNTVDDAEAEDSQDALNAEELANGSVSDAIDALTNAAIDAIATGRNAVVEALPLEWEEVAANANITITNSDLTATGDWLDATAPAASEDPTASHGFFGASGIGEDDIGLIDVLGVTVDLALPESYDPTAQSLYIQSHAHTGANVAPETESLSLAVAKTSTNASVIITNSDLLTQAGDLLLASTAFEQLSLGVSVNGGGNPTTVAIAQKALNNQLVVTGGSLDVDGSLVAGAFTGKSHAISNSTQGNGEADLVLALTYGTSNSLTRADLATTIEAARLDLGAETLYFENTHTTTATMVAAASDGDEEPENSESTNDAAEQSGSRVQSSLTGEDDTGNGSDDSLKDKTAVGAAIDVQLFNDVTIANLGGAANPPAPRVPNITTTLGVTVNATQRYATAAEAGVVANPSVTRQIVAEMGSIAEIVDEDTDEATPDTDDKKFGFFYGMSLAEFGGTTTAQIGADATIDTAGAVVVDALTQFQTTDQILDFDGRFDAAMNLSGLSGYDPTTGETTNPDFSKFEEIFDPSLFLTTTVGVRSIDPAADLNAPAGTQDQDQERALGVSVNLFETDIDTQALIADGAVILNASEVTVNAQAEAVFVHAAANAGAGNLVTGSRAGAGALVGANVSVPRIFSDVVASVGDATLTGIGDLTILSTNDLTQLTVSKSGGLEKASSVAINAAVAASVFETETTSSLGAGAIVDAAAVVINAVDQSRLLTIAGSGGVSAGSSSANASGAINIVRRDTRAIFGADTGVVGSFSADSLNISASNDGVILATGIAGSLATSGGSAPGSGMAIPGNLLGSDAGAVSSKGFAATGSLAMNLMLKNDARALIQTGSDLTLDAGVSLTARNATDDLGLAGGVSVGYGLSAGANLIAGAVAFKEDNRSVITEIDAGSITAATVNVRAEDLTRAVYVAVGGAGGTGSAPVALAGSVVRINEEGVTLSTVGNTAITTTGDTWVDTQNRNNMLAIAGSGSATTDKSVGLSTAQIDSVRDVRVDLSAATITSANLAINARQAVSGTAIGISAALGPLGGSGTVALNDLSGSAIVNASDLTLRAGDVTLMASQDTDQKSYAGSLSAGTRISVGAAAATSINSGGAQVLLRDADIQANTVTLASVAGAALTTRAVGFSVNTGNALGLATAVNRSDMQVLTDIDSSVIYARENIKIDAQAANAVNGAALSLAGAVSNAAAGAANYNDIGNTVTSTVRGSSDVRAVGTLAILSKAETIATLLGGEDGLPDVTGSFAGGGSGAIGVTVTVNDTNNQVGTFIRGETQLAGYGFVGLDVGARLATDGGTLGFGVIIDAFAVTNVDTLASALTIGGKAAVTGAFTYNTLADNAVVQIGNGENLSDASGAYGDGLDVSINVAAEVGSRALEANNIAFGVFTADLHDDYADDSGTNLFAKANQVTQIKAGVENQIDDWAVLATGSGGAAVGAAASGNLILSRAETTLNSSNIAATDDVRLGADIDTRINATSIGLAAGSGAGSASVTYNRVRSDAQLNLLGARISAEGDATLGSDNTSVITSKAGTLAGGKVAGAGAVVTNVVEGQSTVTLTSQRTLRNQLSTQDSGSGFVTQDITTVPSFIGADGLVDIDATSVTVTNNGAISGSIAGAGVAIAVGVTLIDTATRVEIGADQGITASEIAIRALEDTRISDRIGVASATGVGFGSSVNFVDLNGGATVFIGQGADLAAQNDLSVSALADRNVDAGLGVASVAAGSLSAIVSIINVDGSAGEQSSEASATLARAQSSLGEDQTGGNAGQDLLNEVGASDSAAANQADRGATDVTGRLADTSAEGLRDVGIQLGADTTLIAGGDIVINALANANVLQDVGIVALAGLNVSASLGMVDVSSRVDVVVGQAATIEAAGNLTIAAQTTTGEYDANGARAAGADDLAPIAGVFTQGAVASEVTAIGVSASFNVGAGASLVDLSSAARVDILDGVALSSAGEASALNIFATRGDQAAVEIKNAAVAGLAAVGITYTQVENTGQSEVFIGRANGALTQISGADIALRALDQTQAEATSITAQGGGLAAISGAFSKATNLSDNSLIITGSQIDASGLVLIENLNRGVASANATGLAVAGAGSLAVSDANAILNAGLMTTLSGADVTGARIEVTTQIAAALADNVIASSETRTLAGGLAGSGAFADASTSYAAVTTIDDGAQLIAATGSILVRTGAQDVTTRGVATGKAAGALAVGAIIANVGQVDASTNIGILPGANTLTGAQSARKGTAQAINNIDSGALIARDNLLVEARNDQNLIIDVTSGSGAIVGGSFSENNVFHNAMTETNVGATGAEVYLQAGDLVSPDDTRLNGRLTLRAVQSTDLTSLFDNTAASLVGLSGAVSNTALNADVDVVVGGGTTAFANFAEISSQNNVARLANVRNMDSKSGGLATGAVLDSDVTGSFTVNTLIDTGAALYQIGDPDLAKPFTINTQSFYNIGDYLVVDAAGALAAPYGNANVAVTHADAVTINDATIKAAGDLNISSGASAVVTAQQTSTASGLAGIPSARAYGTYSSVSDININSGALVESLSDISINAGYVSGAEQQITVSAEARVFNRTATPITLFWHPVAVATSAITSSVNIGAGAQVIGYQDININASEGVRNVRGYGLAKDFYLELLSDAASLAGVSLVLDIETGETNDTGFGRVDIAGEVRSGAFNRRVLNFDADNNLDNASLVLPIGTGFESPGTAPSSAFYQVVEGSNEIGRLTDARDAVQLQLDNATLDAATRERLLEVVNSYNRRIQALGGENGDPLPRIDIAYLRASEGSVRINASELTGSATGSLFAADEADIRIQVASGALVSLQGLEITEVEGGEITFNDALLSAGDPNYAFDISFAQNFQEAASSTSGDNSIEVIGTSAEFAQADLNGDPLPDSNANGTVEILGRLVNRQGGIEVTSRYGSIYSQGNVEGESINLTAALGLEIVTPAPGIVYAGPAPYTQLDDLFLLEEQTSISNYNRDVYLQQGVNIASRTTPWDYQTFSSLPAGNATSGISAGGNVVLVAEYLNVTAPIRAGTGNFTVDLTGIVPNQAGGTTDELGELQSALNGLAASTRTDRVKLQGIGTSAPGLEVGKDVVFLPGIGPATNADLYFNFATDQIEVDPIRTNGGAIYITADVISTGGGSLEAIDGQGSLQLNSRVSTDIVLNTVDLRSSDNQTGLIRIRDLSKPIFEEGIVVDFLTTDYRSLNGQLSIYDNYDGDADRRNGTIIYDPLALDNAPGRLVQGPTNTSVSQYATTANRDIVHVTENVDLVRMARYKIDLVQGNWNYGHDLIVSPLFRTTKIPLAVAQGYDLGIIGITENIHDFAEPANGYSPVQSSLGGSYDYAYQFRQTNDQLRAGTFGLGTDPSDANAFFVPIYGGGSERLTSIDALAPDDRALIDQHDWTLDDRASMELYYWDGAKGPRNSGRVDLNLWPSDQRLYGLIYDVAPQLRSAEDSLNKLHTIVHAEEFLFVETTTHEHRVRADKPISISFSGGGTNTTSSLNASGNIFFNNDILAPENALSVTSANGSILTTGTNVSVTANALDLTALNGSIGGVGGAAMRLNMVDGAVVSAAARDRISLEEIGGDIVLGTIRTTNRDNAQGASRVGTINVRSAGGMTQTGGGIVDGTDVTLTARAGGIGGGATTPLRIITAGGALDATAQGDVDVVGTSGDLGLGTVTSVTGSVRLEAAAGAVVDRNSEEVQDVRTIEALQALWGAELGLTDPAELAKREAAQIAAFEARINAQYSTYWEQRAAVSGDPVTFVLDSATENALRGQDDPNSTAADARVDAYSAEQNALYAIWNATSTAFVEDYRFDLSTLDTIDTAAPLASELSVLADLRDAISSDLGWTLEELTFSVSQGVVLPTSDTSFRDESANISAAGDITIDAANGVGEILSGYLIAAPTGPQQTLSSLDLAVLAAALPGDLSVDANGNTVVRQEDDVNIDFTGFTDDVPNGALTVTSAASDVYLASEASVRIAGIQTADRVELRTSGKADASVNDLGNILSIAPTGAAIEADSIQLEASLGDIGTPAAPVQITLGATGTFQVASGGSVYIDAPTSDVALVSAFAPETLSLNVAGALTDAIGGAADRVFGREITLEAGAIGTETQTLGIRQRDASGFVDVTSTDNGIHIASGQPLTLQNFNSATGGRIVTGPAAPLQFNGVGTVRFASDATLAFTSDAPVISNDTSGTDITGGTLVINASADWGALTAPITTAVDTLRYSSTLPAGSIEAGDLYLSNTGDLSVAALLQSDNSTSETNISTTGNMEIASAVTAGRLTLDVGGTLGRTAQARVSAGRADIRAVEGIDLAMFGQDTVIEALQVTGATGGLNLAVESGSATLRAGAVTTVGGDQTLRFGENVVMDAGQGISSTTGAIDLGVIGNLDLALISTGSGRADAMIIVVDGELRIVDPTTLSLIADASGAGTTLTLTQGDTTDPLRMMTALDTLTLNADARNVHIDEMTGLTVATVSTGGSIFELYATGDVNLGDMSAMDDIVVSSLSNITTTEATLAADTVHLFAFGGSINTPEVAAFGVVMSPDAILNQFARDNITTRFGDDNGQLGYAIAQTGDLNVDRTLSGGSLEADILAAGGTMTLRALGSIDIDYIGRGEIDLIDEVALDLINRDPNRFGTVAFTGPNHLFIEALNPEARIDLGLAEIKQSADLNADVIDANLYDLTPGDGLTLALSGAEDTSGTRVDLDVIADDPSWTGTDGTSRPDLSDRLMARDRPEQSGLPTASGRVSLDFGRFETGEITTATEEFVVSDVVIGDEAIFRQRLFDLFAETSFSGVRPDMDAQILAVPANGLGSGELDFRMFERRQITTANILTNRPDPTSVIEGGSGTREETLAELATFMSLDRDSLMQGHVVRLPRGLGLAGYATTLPAKGAEEEELREDLLTYKNSTPPLVIIRDN